MPSLKLGQRIPDATLARANGATVETVRLEAYTEGRLVVLVGLPGAFTPICTGQHIPDLLRHASTLKASGIDEIICIAPNSPWVVEEWARRVDPERRLTFLSDGNLELARAAGLVRQAPQLFLGACSARYLMIVRHTIVARLSVEKDIEQLTCTRAQSIDFV